MRLIDREFNVETFAKFPKCTGQFYEFTTGAGCLITAFLAAMGINHFGVVQWQVKDEFYWHHEIMEDLNRLVNVVLPQYNSNSDYGFLGDIIKLYDKGQEPEALNLMWELIDKLPNKTGFAKKEDVIMPPTCKV